MTSPSLLAITPLQHHLESPSGFVIRVAEANLYPSPSLVAAFAGIHHVAARSKDIDMLKLAAILGQSAEQVHGYTCLNTGAWQLCGHSMPLNAYNLNQRICAACVDERGYRPAWMDLAAIDACPKHRIPFQVTCGACNRPIAWTRPGLLKCRCGADLRKSAVGPAHALSDMHVTLLSALIHEFEGERGALANATLGKEFLDLTFSQWLSVIRCLGRMHKLIWDKLGDRSISYTRCAAPLLLDWSAQMSHSLRRLKPEMPHGPGPDALFAASPAIRRYWITELSADVFAKFLSLCQEWPTPGINEEPPEELFSWDAPFPGNIDKATRKPTKASPTSRLTAKALGLPVPVVACLAAQNLISATKSTRRNTIGLEDVEKFKAALLNVSREISDMHNIELMPFLLAVRNKKLGNASDKSEFVAKVLRGEIDVFIGRSRDAEDLMVRASDVAKHVSMIGAKRFSGALTHTSAAAILGVDATTIFGLQRDGQLRAGEHSARLRVTSESVDEFNRRFVAVTALRKGANIGPRFCCALAQKLGIRLFRWQGRREGKAGNYFLERVQASRLEDAILKEIERRKVEEQTHGILHRDPQNSENTWMGIGARPKWLKAYISAGHKVAEFRVTHDGA